MKLSALAVLLASVITTSAISLRDLGGLAGGLALGRRNEHAHVTKSKPHTTSTTTSSPTSSTTSTPAPTLTELSGVAVAVGAIVAPAEVDGSGQARTTPGSAKGQFSLTGFGTEGEYIGPGSVASGIGVGSGSNHDIALALAASAAAITNPSATNVMVNSTASANSTTIESSNGPVTISYAQSSCVVQSAEGDYAMYWAWALVEVRPSGRSVNGDVGGSHRGQASGMASYGESSLTVSAGGSSATVGLSDTGPPFATSTSTPDFTAAGSFAADDIGTTAPDGGPPAGGAVALAAGSPGENNVAQAAAAMIGPRAQQASAAAFAMPGDDASTASAMTS